MSARDREWSFFVGLEGENARFFRRSSETFDAPTFWVLWNPLSPKPPTQRFSSRAQAEKVAADMATRYGEPFYVMEAKALFERQSPPVKKTTLG